MRKIGIKIKITFFRNQEDRILKYGKQFRF